MAFDQIGTVDAFSVGTPAVTLADIVSAEWTVDPELNEHISANSHFGSVSIGNLNCTVKITTTDLKALQSFIKGQEVKTVTVSYKPVVTDIDPSDLSLTRAAGTISFVISCARVMEPVTVTAGSDKKPAEYTVVFKAMRDKATGADPTITPTLTLGGGA